MNKQTAFSTLVLLTLATGLVAPAIGAEGKAVPDAAPTAVAAAPAITKEQAIEMATKAHPGEVIKAYQDTKKGKKTWEVQIKGADGKKWEIHYETKSGALVAEEGK